MSLFAWVAAGCTPLHCAMQTANAYLSTSPSQKVSVCATFIQYYKQQKVFHLISKSFFGHIHDPVLFFLCFILLLIDRLSQGWPQVEYEHVD